MRLLSIISVSAVTISIILGYSLIAGTETVAASNDAPPAIEETFDYPGAARIFAERGILLKKGDGHILLADCASSANLVAVRSRNKGQFCFSITAPIGYVTMELAQAYLIKGDDHSVRATVIVGATTSTVVVPKNEFVPVGEAVDPTQSATLLELRATS